MFGLRSEESDFPAKSCTNWVISAHFGHDHLAAKERSAICRSQASLSHAKAFYVKNVAKIRLIGGFSHSSRDAPM
jgi:hypothetical protein